MDTAILAASTGVGAGIQGILQRSITLTQASNDIANSIKLFSTKLTVRRPENIGINDCSIDSLINEIIYRYNSNKTSICDADLDNIARILNSCGKYIAIEKEKYDLFNKQMNDAANTALIATSATSSSLNYAKSKFDAASSSISALTKYGIDLTSSFFSVWGANILVKISNYAQNVKLNENQSDSQAMDVYDELFKKYPKNIDFGHFKREPLFRDQQRASEAIITLVNFLVSEKNGPTPQTERYQRAAEWLATLTIDINEYIAGRGQRFFSGNFISEPVNATTGKSLDKHAEDYYKKYFKKNPVNRYDVVGGPAFSPLSTAASPFIPELTEEEREHEEEQIRREQEERRRAEEVSQAAVSANIKNIIGDAENTADVPIDQDKKEISEIEKAAIARKQHSYQANEAFINRYRLDWEFSPVEQAYFKRDLNLSPKNQRDILEKWTEICTLSNFIENSIYNIDNTGKRTLKDGNDSNKLIKDINSIIFDLKQKVVDYINNYLEKPPGEGVCPPPNKSVMNTGELQGFIDEIIKKSFGELMKRFCLTRVSRVITKPPKKGEPKKGGRTRKNKNKNKNKRHTIKRKNKRHSRRKNKRYSNRRTRK